MTHWIANQEMLIRGSVFLCVVLLCIWAERRFPRRQRITSAPRVFSNLAMPLIATLFVRLLIPLLPVGAAFWSQQTGFGLLNIIAVPVWLSALTAFLLLDAGIYWQHRLMHRVPVLWRLHRMHHSDTIVDVTTGIRFHPLEIIVSLMFKIGMVVAIGAPIVAVIVFEIILNAASLFNHSNLAIPARVEPVLRKIIVTPDMHRIHHSVTPFETDSNFSFSLSAWDRLFGTYTDQPATPHETMPLGLAEYRGANDQHLVALLRQPFGK